MKPNILFLMTDQMRGDCLGVAGHPHVKTPYLDSLAVRGDYFPNMYTACPSCIAARASLMTGLDPRHTGRVGYQDGVAWDFPVTLADVLHKGGYYTKCVGKMHVHPLRNNLGFDDVVLHDGHLGYYHKPDISYYEHQNVADDYFHWIKSELGVDASIIDTGLECNSWVSRPWIYDEKYHPTNWVVSQSIDFLRKRDRSKPFFLFTSFVRPHPPFDAPSCYFDLYNRMELTPPPGDDWSGEDYAPPTSRPEGLRGRTYDGDDGIADPELQRQAQVGYYACITHLDHQIGRLLMAMEEDGCARDTIILFTSDHGELLGDHHSYRKTRPYQGSVQVPMLFRVPGGNSGALHRELIGLQDILPTLAELAGTDIPEGIDGISFAQQLKPELCGENRKREYLHGEHSGGSLGNQFLVTETDKYIWYMQSGKEEYFNLVEDPMELHNQIGEPACQERITLLRKLLIAELDGREEGYTDGISLFPGKKQRNVLSSVGEPSQK